jgi:protein tyrosine/serine phosphatase
MKEVYYLKFKLKPTNYKKEDTFFVYCGLLNWNGHNYCVLLQICVLRNHKFKYERLLLQYNSFICVLVFT